MTKYKNLCVTGYTGLFHISTTQELLNFVYDSGLGGKNAQGFGFLRAVGAQPGKAALTGTQE